MNLLIVDPDIESIAHTKDLLFRERFNISNVFTATTITSAKEIIEGSEITLILSDYSFSDGTVLEFTSWLNSHYPRIALILITSVKDFEVAQKALNLGIAGYLNKPVDKKQLSIFMEQALSRNTPAPRQEFWMSLIYNECLITPHNLQRFGLTPEETAHVTPIVFSWNVPRRYLNILKHSVINFTLKNIATELLLGKEHAEDLLVVGKYIVIFCTGERSHYDNLPELKKTCDLIVTNCSEFLEFCNVSCYLSDSVSIENVCTCVNELFHFETQDICKETRTINIRTLPQQEIIYQRPAVEQWAKHLFSSNPGLGIAAIHNYLETLHNYNRGVQRALRYFQTDLIQEVSRILSIKKIDSHTILDNNHLVELLPLSTNSLEDMNNWINELLHALKLNLKSDDLPHFAVVEKVKDYITRNLNTDINRNDLASLVYLHPDSLSHIFKVQTGINISDYILQEHLKTAKIMLMTTDKKVSDISIDIGYDNVPYFIKVFKKNTGFTPREYRQQRLYKIS